MKRTSAKALALLLTLAMLITCAVFPASAAKTGTLEIYPEYPEELPRNYDYIVSVSDGEGEYTIPVYNSTRKDNAYHGNAGSARRFCEFGFSGTVTVKVTSRLAMNSAALLPTSEGVNCSVSGNTITFTLDEPKNLALRLNDNDDTILSIFAESILEEFVATEGRKVLYFDAGLNNINTSKTTAVEGSNYSKHSEGRLRIKDDVDVYLAPVHL